MRDLSVRSLRGPMLLLLLLAACRRDAGPPVTFTEDVAPILFQRCVPCHHPGGSGPFNLLTFRDARTHARQIARVTASRFMPPWLPDDEGVSFLAERRLTDEQLATIQHWVEQGAPEGDPARLPPAPKWDAEWYLGPPDLVVEMPEAFTLGADGPDLYRNFVLPAPVSEPRYVRAVEFDPGNAKAVHHARVLLDRTPVSRYRDAESQEPGFAGMDAGAAESPDGHLLGWTPGKVPWAGNDDIAWRLEPGDDLVVQLHMVRTGKPETVRARLGLHFAEGPPKLHPYALVLGSRDIDIPPGVTDYRVETRFTLPVDVEALGIYPHAHYVGKEMKVWAELPDGTRRWLIHIPDWDFNWQDEYRYAPPIPLPRGSTIRLEYIYDNSTGNPRNPSSPPRRVVYGPNSTDEMCEVMIQILPRNEADRAVLAREAERQKVAEAIAFRKRLLEADPRDAASHSALASSYVYIGRPDLAVPHLEAALRIGPESPGLHQNLGYVLRRLGKPREAEQHYRRALELRPGSAEVQFDLANTLVELGETEEALGLYRGVIELRPEFAGPYAAAARLIVSRPGATASELAEALRFARRAAELTSHTDPQVLRVLAAVYAARGERDRSRAAEEQARALEP